MDKQKKKYVHTMKYCPAIIRIAPQPNAATWISFTDIMLSKRIFLQIGTIESTKAN